MSNGESSFCLYQKQPYMFQAMFLSIVRGRPTTLILLTLFSWASSGCKDWRADTRRFNSEDSTFMERRTISTLSLVFILIYVFNLLKSINNHHFIFWFIITSDRKSKTSIFCTTITLPRTFLSLDKFWADSKLIANGVGWGYVGDSYVCTQHILEDYSQNLSHKIL